MFNITIESTFAKGCLIVARLVVLTATGGGAAEATTRTRLLDLTKKKNQYPSTPVQTQDNGHYRVLLRMCASVLPMLCVE